MRCLSLPITRNERIQGSYYVISFHAPELAPCCKPGMFFELKADIENQDKRLFKPISIYKVGIGEISFLYKVIGEGTTALAALDRGDLIKLIGPLGTAFPIADRKRVLLVSGGVGYPPLEFLRTRLAPSNDVFFVHGGAGREDVFPCDQTYTDDGSCGTKGFVTANIKELIQEKQIDMVYSCGPLPMLKVLAELVSPVEHYVSLEAYMACGVGVCHGCAVPIDDTYLRVCKDGPIFAASRIRWEVL